MRSIVFCLIGALLAFIPHEHYNIPREYEIIVGVLCILGAIVFLVYEMKKNPDEDSDEDAFDFDD